MQKIQTKLQNKTIKKSTQAKRPPKKQKQIAIQHDSSIEIEDEETQDIRVYKGVSIPKYLRHPHEYQFLEVPVIVPTPQEMINPFKLVKRLHQEGYMKHGIVKIKMDKSKWNPQCIFDSINKPMSTRMQVINELSEGKTFQQNVDEYTYQEFKEMSQEFDDTYEYQTKIDIDNQYRKNEYEYYSILEHPDKFKEVEIEYAADLPSTKFGSAFSDESKVKKYEQGWNLQQINGQKGSLFQFVGHRKQGDLSGITNPWIYLGMKFATFCFHTEDLWMYALNYLHHGAAKTWYTVPPQYKEKFEDVYRTKYAKVFKEKPDIMYRLNLQLCPCEATRAYIPIYRVDQEPGDFIMTFPKVYHGGFSHGFNIGEAVNIASTEWLKYYREAVQDYALKGYLKKVSYPLEWMLIQVINELDKSDFDQDDLEKIKSEWVQSIKIELQNRQTIYNTYGNKLVINEFANKNVKYDRLVCKSCTAYMFLSYLYCNKCLKSGCISHVSTCACLNNKVSLYLRYNDEELQQFTEIIDSHIEKLKQQ